MSWARFIRLVIGAVFVSVPALAWAVLWPATPGRSSSPGVVCALPLPAVAATSDEQAADGAAQESAPVQLLNHWEYTSADWKGYSPMRGWTHSTSMGYSMSPVKPIMMCGCQKK